VQAFVNKKYPGIKSSSVKDVKEMSDEGSSKLSLRQKSVSGSAVKT
jgi:hypothetical protein